VAWPDLPQAVKGLRTGGIGQVVIRVRVDCNDTPSDVRQGLAGEEGGRRFSDPPLREEKAITFMLCLPFSAGQDPALHEW